MLAMLIVAIAGERSSWLCFFFISLLAPPIQNKSSEQVPRFRQRDSSLSGVSAVEKKQIVDLHNNLRRLQNATDMQLMVGSKTLFHLVIVSAPVFIQL